MTTWLVWEADYPDEGSTEVQAWTEKGACRKWRQMTRTRGATFDMPELGVCEATPAMLAARAREAA